jgi:thiol:disulfide interchange protein DsbD
VPITVNFFVKQGQHNKGKTTGLAVAYCLAIIGAFTGFGVFVSRVFESTALQNLANNPWLNTFVAAMFVIFGLSLLGLFEVRLPNFLLNATSKGESRGGIIGVMFMALTLMITSFTCTFPVVGGLVVMAASGKYFYPIIGLATFSAVLAFPFFLLALAPGLIAKMPKSGDWMNAVKVVGGLVEIGAALKFVNTAEIGFGAVPEDAWFDASLVLSAWVVLAAICGLYLLGFFRTDHDHDEVKIGPGRLLAGSLFLALALFLFPALVGRPPKSPLWHTIVGILPADVGDLEAPVSGGDAGGGAGEAAKSKDPEVAEREQTSFHGVVWGLSYEQAVEKAKAEHKPILIDFTGVNCVNCRAMESGVMPRKEIVSRLSKFITVQLYTDFVPIASITQAQREALAEKNQNRLLELSKDVSNPIYVTLSPDGHVLKSIAGKRSPADFAQFLDSALNDYETRDKVAQRLSAR